MFWFGRKKNVRYEPGELIFDYYDGQAGLPMEPGYDEITLTATENSDKLRMDVYHRPAGDGEVETKASYLVSSKALEDAMKLVQKHKLTNWNKRTYPCMCGRKTVCRFKQDDELVGATSDNMPKNGMAAFADIHCALCGYIDPKSKIDE